LLKTDFFKIHPSIINTAYPHSGRGALEPIPADRVKAGTPWTGQSIEVTETHNHSLYIQTSVNLTAVFGLWEEAGEPGGNPRCHMENMLHTEGPPTPGIEPTALLL